MTKQLSRKTLETILQAENIEQLSLDQLTQFVMEEEGVAQYAPDGICQIDPRNGDRIVFNSARARRPHDNRPPETDEITADTEKDCVICQGRTTHVIDVTDLSEGFTFINKNLFPIFFPIEQPDNKSGQPIHGFHFLQWTSSLHHRDWHNMPLADSIIVMQRLGVLEKKLLNSTAKYVSIIKNYGHLVGGSLVHGHQQIGASNIIPNRHQQDIQFKNERGETFSSYMLRENPPNLVIQDYETAVLITPYFMRRPFDMQLILKDSAKSHLFQLNERETADVARSWRDAIRIMLGVMQRIGREPAYNITTHNGDGAGLYFEFLPYTQEMGGFEHIGLYSCQGNPGESASYARSVLAQYGEGENH